MRWLLLLVAIMACGCESKYDRAKAALAVESAKLDTLQRDYEAANAAYEKVKKVSDEGIAEIDAKLKEAKRFVDRDTYESLERKSEASQQQSRAMIAEEFKRVRDLMHAIGSQQRSVDAAREELDKMK